MKILVENETVTQNVRPQAPPSNTRMLSSLACYICRGPEAVVVCHEFVGVVDLQKSE